MRNAVVARLDSMGDVLLSGPAIRAVASRADRLTLLCGPQGRAAAELLPGVDQIIEFRAPWIDPEPPVVDRALIDGLVAELHRHELTEAIILTSFHQSALPTALVLRLAGVSRIAAISPDYPGSLLDVRHAVDDRRHEVERSLSLAEAAGYPLPPSDDRRLSVAKPATADALDPLGLPEDYVVVHPGASVPARAWPAARYRQLVAALRRDGWPVVVTGTPSERMLTATVAGAAEDDAGVLDLGGRSTLADLAAVLAGATVTVVGNTGPAHLSAAVGTPVVSLFAASVPVERWRPWGVPHVILGDQAVPCAGCRARVCPELGHPCLTAVDADMVRHAVRQLAGTPLLAPPVWETAS